jgi:drug/metabolite transporter (DMT)-like permease
MSNLPIFLALAVIFVGWVLLNRHLDNTSSRPLTKEQRQDRRWAGILGFVLLLGAGLIFVVLSG